MNYYKNYPKLFNFFSQVKMYFLFKVRNASSSCRERIKKSKEWLWAFEAFGHVLKPLPCLAAPADFPLQQKDALYFKNVFCHTWRYLISNDWPSGTAAVCFLSCLTGCAHSNHKHEIELILLIGADIIFLCSLFFFCTICGNVRENVWVAMHVLRGQCD